MNIRRWRVRSGWRVFGLVLVVWVIFLPLLEHSDPLRAAASAVQPQGVSVVARSKAEAQSAPPAYLIIAPDEFAPVLAGYLAAKQAEGYEVILRTLSQTGSTPANIRAAVLAVSPQYLLLVGDVDLLPAWESRNGLTTPTDLYYTTLDGPWDYTPNLAYARLPVHSTAELQTVLAKWADYRTHDGSQAWLSRAAFIAGGKSNESIHNQMIEQYTLPAGYGGEFPQNPQPGGDRLYVHSHAANNDDLTTALNAGRGLAVYFGQGGVLGWDSPYFTVIDVQALTGRPLPLLVSFASRTAELRSNHTSFAEAWLLRPTSGALALIAAGSETTASADERLERELFKALFTSRSPSLPAAEALRLALQELSRYYLPSEQIIRQYYEMYSLWGDPTLRLWLDAPRRFSLELEPQTVSVCGGQTHTFTGQVTLNSSQTSTVTLSLHNLPQGVSGDFSSNPVPSPGITTVTLNLPSSLAPDQYSLTVRGDSGYLQREAWLSLMVRPAAPSNNPLPLLPANGAVQVSLRPQLSWSAVESADHYEVQIALDVNFEQIVASLEDIPQTVFTLSEDLRPSQTYYWRVGAKNGCGAGGYSPIARFTTLPPPGECPLGSQPEVLYAQAFDTIPDDWGLEGGWQTGSAFGRGGVVKTGAPPEIRRQFLTSPLFALPEEADVLAVELRAEMAYDFGEPPACLDGARLEVSTDDGRTWAKLPEEALLTPPYDGQLAVSFGNPLGGSPAWCHRRDWSPLAVDLTAFRGQEVRLRFVVATGADGQFAPGLALDNFEVIACYQDGFEHKLILTPARQAMILPPGRSAKLEWQVFNQSSTVQFVSLTANGNVPIGITPELIDILPGETGSFQVEVNLPDSAVPGEEYIIGLLAHSAGSPSLWAAGELRITVRRCGLTLAAPSGIPPMARGETSTIFITVTNTGNAVDTFHLSAAISPGWQTSLPASLSVAAAETQWVDLAVRSPADARLGDESLLSITARSAACQSVEQSLERLLFIQGSRLFFPVVGR